MPALIPQEIYLLERYTSKEYFVLARDAWDEMVRHVEACLDLFMRELPADYRNRPLWNQPDVVWGERVLPNFRLTRDHVNDAYIRLTHGDKQALGAASRITSDFRGQSDSSPAWMGEASVAKAVPNAEAEYYELLHQAVRPASNIATTVDSQWPWTLLGSRYNNIERGELDPPMRWPKYRLNHDVRVSTGKLAPQTGVYLPTVSESSPRFLIEGNEVYRALVGLNADHNQYREKVPGDWILIERIPGEFVDDPLTDLLSGEVTLTRVERVPAGKPCPETGWWHTPAKANSRRYFKQGETFPNIEGSEYGSTFWLWTQDQSS